MGRKVDVDDLVSLAEIAERLNLTSREAVRSWRQRFSDFPQAIARLAGVHVYAWPDVTFEWATAWLVERRVLLPGASVLARLVTAAREATVDRLLDGLGGRISPEQVSGLGELLVVDEDSRSSRLEHLRQAPTRISSTGMLYALERLGDVRALGVSSVDVSELPVGRVRELARWWQHPA